MGLIDKEIVADLHDKDDSVTDFSNSIRGSGEGDIDVSNRSRIGKYESYESTISSRSRDLLQKNNRRGDSGVGISNNSDDSRFEVNLRKGESLDSVSQKKEYFNRPVTADSKYKNRMISDQKRIQTLKNTSKNIFKESVYYNTQKAFRNSIVDEEDDAQRGIANATQRSVNTTRYVVKNRNKIAHGAQKTVEAVKVTVKSVSTTVNAVSSAVTSLPVLTIILVVILIIVLIIMLVIVLDDENCTNGIPLCHTSDTSGLWYYENKLLGSGSYYTAFGGNTSATNWINSKDWEADKEHGNLAYYVEGGEKIYVITIGSYFLPHKNDGTILGPGVASSCSKDEGYKFQITTDTDWTFTAVAIDTLGDESDRHGNNQSSADKSKCVGGEDGIVGLIWLGDTQPLDAKHVLGTITTIERLNYNDIDGDVTDSVENCSSGTSNVDASWKPDYSNREAWYPGGLNHSAGVHVTYGGRTSTNTPGDGQCVYYADGFVAEIYGISGPSVNGDVYASTLVAQHPDKFTLSTVPKAGGIYSIPGPHVGIILEVNESQGTVVVADGNIENSGRIMVLTRTISELSRKGAVYANPK